MTLTDEMLVCERCGVTFLWTIEDSKAGIESQENPTHCMGCSSLLPAGGRERGLVKWYNPSRRYGFITRAEGPDLFAHRSRFEGVTRLQPGDLVEFGVEETDRGAAAVDLRLLSRRPKEKKPESRT